MNSFSKIAVKSRLDIMDWIVHSIIEVELELREGLSFQFEFSRKTRYMYLSENRQIRIRTENGDLKLVFFNGKYFHR